VTTPGKFVIEDIIDTRKP